MLVRSPFDFQVKLAAVHPEGDIRVTVNGKPFAKDFGMAAQQVAEEADKTGPETRVNALGVHADRTPPSQHDPRVEPMAEALRRTTGKSIGVVSTAGIEDATPAAVVAHAARR